MDSPIKGSAQGSILGPLLFNVFINDMYMFINECTLFNYAVDNSLSCTSHTCMIDHEISNLQLDGNRAIKWFTDNGMQANPDKFQFMIISSDGNSTLSLTLNENTVIVLEKHVKVLGVVIDCRLNISLHISTVCKCNGMIDTGAVYRETNTNTRLLPSPNACQRLPNEVPCREQQSTQVNEINFPRPTLRSMDYNYCKGFNCHGYGRCP